MCGDVGNLQNECVCAGGGGRGWLECGFICIYEALYQIWVSASTPRVVGVGNRGSSGRVRCGGAATICSIQSLFCRRLSELLRSDQKWGKYPVQSVVSESAMMS